MPIRPAAQHRAPGRRRSLGLLCGIVLTPLAVAAAVVFMASGGGFLRLGLSSGGPAHPSPAPMTTTSPASLASTGGSPTPSSSASPSPSRVTRKHHHRRQARPSTAPKPTPEASAAPPSQQAAAGQVLALINQARAQAGLPAYSLLAGLDDSAAAHNARMAGGCGLSHQCPGEPPIGTRETDAGVTWTAAGENIGEGGAVPDTPAAIAQMAVSLTQDMLNEKPPDDGHRLNILSSAFRFIGIAVTIDGSGTVWMTQDFAN